MTRPLQAHSAAWRIGILGGRGMLGSDLAAFFSERGTVFAIDKDNYAEFRGQSFDVLINANGNSRRFWANEHPAEDFEASTLSVYKSFADFTCGTYVYISTSDVYPEHGDPNRTSEDEPIDLAKLEPYGLHKHMSELLVRENAKSWLVLRSSLMLGTNIVKGPVFDLVNRKPLFISRETVLQMVTTQAIAEAISTLLDSGVTNEIFNIGGRGTCSFDRLEQHVGGPIQISPDAKTQRYEMNVQKLSARYPLKTSVEYLEGFFSARKNAS